MAVYKDGKKTSDLNVQADFNVEDTTSDAYVKNRPDSTLSISFNGVVQERTYNPNTGNEVININIDNLIKERNDKITEAVENLDASDTLTPGNYYTGMTEKDGIVSMTQSDMDTTPTENSMKPVTSGGVRAAINSLDSSDTLSVGNYYTGVTEKDGIINMSQAAMDTAPTLNSSKPVTSGGVLTALNNAIDSLDASDTLDQGKYYTGIKEENGVISMTQSDMDTTPTENSKKPVTSGGVKSYIDNAIDALDSSSTLTSGNYYTGMKETNGVVVMDQAVMDSTPTENSKKPVTSGGVRAAIDSLDSKSTLTSGNYYTGMNEKDGIVTMSQAAMDITPTDDSKKPVTSGGAKTYIDNAIDALDSSDTLTAGNYYTGVSEVNGIVSMTQSAMDTTPTKDSKKPVTSGGVKSAISSEASARNTAISNAINALDVSDTAVNGEYVSSVSETNGKVSVSRKSFSSSVVEGDSNAPSGAAVFTAIQSLGTLYHIKDSVASYEALSALDTTSLEPGEVRNVIDTGDNYVWTGTVWDRLGGTTIVDALDYSSPSVSGNTTSFIDTVSQTNGKIAATKKTITSASTSTKGIVQLSSSTSSTSEVLAATPKAVKAVQDAVTSEATARATADENEVTARNTAISTAVSAEATARDEAISTAISAEVTNRNTAISNAVKALDGIVTGTAGAANTLTAFSEEDGKVSATFGAIQIASSQVTGLDTALAGKQEKGSYKTVQTAVSSPTASGTSLSFIDSVSQNTNGVITATKKAVTTMGAATASANGTAGLVPAPAAGAQAKYLRADGTWNTPTNTTYSAATTSDAGLMSAADKIKLDGIATGANNYTYILQTATATILGGVKSKATGTTANRDYNVQVNSDGTMKVNVPWTDNNTTYGVVSTTAAGLVPKGTAVSTQSQSTKFLREDGTWAAPSYSSGNSLTIGTGANQAAAGNHTHSQYLTSHQDISGKLNRSGDILTIKGDKYSVNNEYGINMANSDIVGANAIVFNDNAEAGGGLIFSNDAKSSFDSIRMEGGELKITTGSSNSSCKDGHSYSISVVNAW